MSIQKILQKIESLNKSDAFWCVPKETADFLRFLTIKMNAQNVLEVGTSIGYSALHFAQALQKTGGKLHTIESHKERSEIAQQHFEKAGVNNIVKLHRGHAPEIFSENITGAPIDIAFFDGIKKETQQHIKAVRSYMNAHGIMIADNTKSHREAMEPLFDYLVSEHLEYVELPIGDGLVLM